MILNLGELYFFDKQLDSSVSSLAEINIMGVEFSSKMEKLSPVELLNKYKDDFIDKYSEILRENNQTHINYIWNKITDVFLVEGNNINPEITTDDNLIEGILNLINDWIDNGQKIEELQGVLSEIEVITANSLQGFSLYYGLRVLYYLSSLLIKYNNIELTDFADTVVAENNFDPFDLNQKDIILGICPPSLSGLFNSSGIETITNIDDPTSLINAIEGFVQKKPETKLLISLSITDSTLEKIEKRFAGKLIICPIPENVGNINKENYFAKLALKTIGLPKTALIS